MQGNYSHKIDLIYQNFSILFEDKESLAVFLVHCTFIHLCLRLLVFYYIIHSPHYVRMPCHWSKIAFLALILTKANEIEILTFQSNVMYLFIWRLQNYFDFCFASVSLLYYLFFVCKLHSVLLLTENLPIYMCLLCWWKASICRLFKWEQDILSINKNTYVFLVVDPYKRKKESRSVFIFFQWLCILVLGLSAITNNLKHNLKVVLFWK